jgi:hypothetical protein
MNLYDEFRDLIEALNREEVDYGVCGGIALAIHGFPRFTKDIDLLILPQDLDGVIAVAADRGFLVVANPLHFDSGKPTAREVRRISKIEGEDVLTLDLLLANGILQKAWDDREEFLWQGRSIKVVSARGLVLMKKIAGRDQDLLDVKKLEAQDDDDEH